MMSTSQQIILDNLDDNDVSPSIKQCRGDDDTSSGMSPYTLYLLLNFFPYNMAQYSDHSEECGTHCLLGRALASPTIGGQQ